MGAVFALGFTFTVVFIGVTIAVFGIGGEALFATLMVRGKRFGKPLLVVSAVVTRIGALVALTPMLLFGLIVTANFFPSSDFVKTETAIEFTDDTWESFTADGVTYVCIDDINSNWGPPHNVWTPVFHYIPDALVERYLSFNCYSIQNDSGYELIDADGWLYCKAEDKNAVLDYYLNESKRTYYFDTQYSDFGDYGEEDYRLPSEIENVLDELCSLDQKALELKEFTFYNDDEPDTISIDVISEDGAVVYDYLWLGYLNGQFYIFEYSDFPSDIDIDSNAMIYGLRLLPEDINEILVNYFWGV